MRKITLIKKHKDKLVLTNGNKEICNIMLSNSSKSTQATLCIETDDPDLTITREEIPA